jgi:hypothetical protein
MMTDLADAAVSRCAEPQTKTARLWREHVDLKLTDFPHKGEGRASRALMADSTARIAAGFAFRLQPEPTPM